jgi:hypothetical protein
METLAEFQTCCSQQAPELRKILDTEYGFNLSNLHTQVYNLQPHLCKLLFSSLLYCPFDIHSKEHIYLLLDTTKRDNNSLAKILHFLYHIQSTVPNIYHQDTSKLTSLQQRQEYTDSLPLNTKVPRHSLNPFKINTRFAIIFDYLIEYTGSADLWPRYLIRILTKHKFDINYSKATNYHFKQALTRHHFQFKVVQHNDGGHIQLKQNRQQVK